MCIRDRAWTLRSATVVDIHGARVSISVTTPVHGHSCLVPTSNFKYYENYDYKARLKQTQGYWAIPQTEIDKSNGVLEQNPGWEPTAQFTDWNNM